jgi:hypothetical protein
MRQSLATSRRLIGGLATMSFLGIGAVVWAIEVQGLAATPLSNAYLKSAIGGDGPAWIPKSCCIKPSLTPCTGNNMFACVVAPIQCNAGNWAVDSCGAATCNTGVEGQQCAVDTGGGYSGNQCTATGETEGCYTDMESCIYLIKEVNLGMTYCVSGSSLCTAGQPSPACQ